jgi:hypothetical protein
VQKQKNPNSFRSTGFCFHWKEQFSNNDEGMDSKASLTTTAEARKHIRLIDPESPLIISWQRREFTMYEVSSIRHQMTELHAANESQRTEAYDFEIFAGALRAINHVGIKILSFRDAVNGAQNIHDRGGCTAVASSANTPRVRDHVRQNLLRFGLMWRREGCSLAAS